MEFIAHVDNNSIRDNRKERNPSVLPSVFFIVCMTINYLLLTCDRLKRYVVNMAPTKKTE